MVPLLLIQLTSNTVAFKPFWLTTVNQPIGPTPQEPSPR